MGESISRTSTILRSEGVKTTLGEYVMSYIPNRKTFSGHLTVEVHCKDGVVLDVFLATRVKVVES